MHQFLLEIKLVWHGMTARKGRSFLTMLGIVIGVAGVIIIIALGAGAQSLVLSQVTKLGSNLLAIMPGKSDNGPPAAAFGVTVTTLVPSDAEALRDMTRFPHITAVAAGVQGTGTAIWRNENVDTNFEASEPDIFRISNVELESGSFFDDSQKGANVTVLGQDVKKQLFGDSDPIGQVIKFNNIPLTVVGVLKARGTVFFQNEDDKIYLPFVIGQKQILGINYTQAISVKIDDAKNVDTTVADINQLMRERHHIKDPADDDFSVMNLADAIKILTTVTDALALFLAVMAGISLVVGGIGIMNIMLVTVAERTREIGLRKALGATNRNVRNQFLLESSMVTMFGGMGGVIFGVLVSYLIALVARLAGFEWAFIISPVSILLALGVSVLTGMVFGLYPAFKASKLDPIVALRYE